MANPREHKFVHEQLVEVDGEVHCGHVQVQALLPGHCAEHQAPMYGCAAGDQAFSFCEDILKPLSPTNKRKLN